MSEEELIRRTLDWLDDARACLDDPIFHDDMVRELIEKGAGPSDAVLITRMTREAQAIARSRSR